MNTYKGIDVSRYQGDINWAQVDASGIDFSLVKAGCGNVISQKDANFDYNVQQALAHGLHVGAYWFGYAISVSDAQKEADVFNQVLSPYRGKLTFPVAYDYEYDSVRYFKEQVGREPTNAEIDSFAQAFLDRMKSYGWFVNVYTNLDYYRSGKFANSVKKYDVWLADYSGGPDYPCYIQQTGSKGIVPGISGNVDVDISFRDYPAAIRAGGYNGFPKPQQAVIKSDTTQNITFKQGEMYTVKTTSAQMPELWAGTNGIVIVKHCRREGNDDFWHLIFIGEPGQATGIYACAPGVTTTKQFVANVA